MASEFAVDADLDGPDAFVQGGAEVGPITIHGQETSNLAAHEESQLLGRNEVLLALWRTGPSDPSALSLFRVHDHGGEPFKHVMGGRPRCTAGDEPIVLLARRRWQDVEHEVLDGEFCRVGNDTTEGGRAILQITRQHGVEIPDDEGRTAATASKLFLVLPVRVDIGGGVENSKLDSDAVGMAGRSWHREPSRPQATFLDIHYIETAMRPPCRKQRLGFGVYLSIDEEDVGVGGAGGRGANLLLNPNVVAIEKTFALVLAPLAVLAD